MAHFAQVKGGYVLQVIVAEQDVIDSGIVGDPSEWYKTSYNTKGGVHYDPTTNLPDGGVAFRKNLRYLWEHMMHKEMHLFHQNLQITKVLCVSHGH